jgi:RNA polymerase sigma factor (sigma-70 family)
LSTTTFDRSFKEIDTEQAFIALRAGDETAREPLIKGLIYFVCKVARTTNSHPAKINDLIAEAIKTLVEETDKVAERADFTHFKKALYLRVKGALILYMSTDYTIKPSYNGEACKRDNLYNLCVSLETPLRANQAITLGELLADRRAEQLHSGLPLELADCLDHRCLTPREKQVAVALVYGKNNVEIAKDLGVSKVTVATIKEKLLPKLERILKGEW